MQDAWCVLYVHSSTVTLAQLQSFSQTHSVLRWRAKQTQSTWTGRIKANQQNTNQLYERVLLLALPYTHTYKRLFLWHFRTLDCIYSWMYATNNMQIEFSTPNPKSNSKFNLQNYKEMYLLLLTFLVMTR